MQHGVVFNLPLVYIYISLSFSQSLFLLYYEMHIVTFYSVHFSNRNWHDLILYVFLAPLSFAPWFAPCTRSIVPYRRVCYLFNSTFFYYFLQLLISPFPSFTYGRGGTIRIDNIYSNFALFEWQKLRIGSVI